MRQEQGDLERNYPSAVTEKEILKHANAGDLHEFLKRELAEPNCIVIKLTNRNGVGLTKLLSDISRCVDDYNKNGYEVKPEYNLRIKGVIEK